MKKNKKEIVYKIIKNQIIKRYYYYYYHHLHNKLHQNLIAFNIHIDNKQYGVLFEYLEK